MHSGHCNERRDDFQVVAHSSLLTSPASLFSSGLLPSLTKYDMIDDQVRVLQRCLCCHYDFNELQMKANVNVSIFTHSICYLPIVKYRFVFYFDNYFGNFLTHYQL